jgi:leucyl-tRNA---protein transferase
MEDAAQQDTFPDLFASPCGYFDERTSHYTVFQLPTPEDSLKMIQQENPGTAEKCSAETCQQLIFDDLLAEGFRRADDYIYRADCPDCKKCIPIRLAVKSFKPSKSQRHTLRHNSDITLSITGDAAQFVTGEKILLYSEYDKRHNTGTTKTAEEYKAELMQMNGSRHPHKKSGEAAGKGSSSPVYSGTLNMEYRIKSENGAQGRLIGVGIVDAALHSLSSNYFYYDISPEIMKRSLGTYSILREIDLCRRLKFKWYYLGYWLAECRKMVYKANFNPHQLLQNNIWKTVENNDR